ncbi:hypothetical protein ANN_04391 [Periplaneta americana]|uniref:Uncharacterized protein n=1 Tax=Periplaneta americana TaxID=6978 RepID=A0ABQ8T8F0_PERAM|nr:hypothetical protein ANN_04391 [Periplaneta americana]
MRSIVSFGDKGQGPDRRRQWTDIDRRGECWPAGGISSWLRQKPSKSRSFYRRPPGTAGSLDRPLCNVAKRRWMASATSTRGGPTRGGVSPRTDRGPWGKLPKQEWGFVKDAVYRTPVKDLQDFLARITAAIAQVNAKMLGQIWAEVEYRLDILRVTNGAHIDFFKLVSKLQWVDRIAKEMKIVVSIPDRGDNSGGTNPGSSTESYPAFAQIGLGENPRKKPQPGNLPQPGTEPEPPSFAARRANRYSTVVDLKTLILKVVKKIKSNDN